MPLQERVPMLETTGTDGTNGIQCLSHPWLARERH